MHDEQVTVDLLGDLLTYAVAHHSLGQSRLARPDDHEIGVPPFGEGHDRRGRIAGHGLGLDAMLGEERRRVGELRS